MADTSDALEKLRPLRPPPADGVLDILIMAVAGCALAAALVLAIRFLHDRQRPLRRAAIASLAASRALPASDRLVAQATILREVAGAFDDGARTLRGEEWLARLDVLFSTRLFSDGPGRVFGDALYQPRTDNPAEALDGELARLFGRLEK